MDNTDANAPWYLHIDRQTISLLLPSILTLSHISSSNNWLNRVEKYRPESLDDLISHTDIVSTLTKLIDLNRLP